MTTAAKDTFGTVLRLADTGGTPALVAELTDITPPAISRDTMDATTHDGSDDAMEFIADGVYDPGEISVSGHLIGGSTAHDLFIDALVGAVVQDFEIDYKAATGLFRDSGSCLVTNFTPGAMPVQGGKQEFSATLKVTGAITRAAVA